MAHLYTLDDDGNPQPTEDVLGWGRWMENSDVSRVVKQSQMPPSPRRPYHVGVSTVFLGIDHRFDFGPDGEQLPPVLFETLVFGGPDAGLCCRYCTRIEALIGHDKMVARVFGAAQLLDAPVRPEPGQGPWAS